MKESEYKYKVCTLCFTFNHAPYIEDAMNGFVMQVTSFPVISIIVDDASTDGEPKVIRNYLAEHFKLPYRTEETEYAHIICAKHKTNDNCEFVVFLLKYNHYSIKKSKFPYLSEWLDNAKYHALCEGDDYWIDPLKLQTQVNYLEDHDSCGMVHSRAAVLVEPSKSFGKISKGSDFRSFHELLLSNKVVTLTTCVRRRVLKDYYNNLVAWPENKDWKMGDYPMWLWIAKYYDVFFLDKVTGVYRVLPESASHSKSIDNEMVFLENSLNVQLLFARKFNVPDDVVDELHNLFVKSKIHIYCKHRRYKDAMSNIPMLKKQGDKIKYAIIVFVRFLKK